MKKLAFLVLVHADPQHLGQLVSVLDYHSDVFIHVDKKSDISPFRSVVRTNNVRFLEKRVSVSWAGISMIDAQMALIEEVLQSQETYSHLMFLSGADYPIVPIRQIHQKLTENSNKQFIRFIDMRQSPDVYMKQISQKWFKEPWIRSKNKPLAFIDKAVRKVFSMMKIKNHWESRMVPYFGSQWVALTADCCRYLLDFQADNPWFREMNKYTYSPDEHYIHTLVGNSPFLESSDGVQPFQGRGTWRLANLHIVDQSLAKWYTVQDWEAITRSDKLFVRKVRSADGKELVDRINRELLK